MVCHTHMKEKRTETISSRIPKSMALDLSEKVSQEDRNISDWLYLLIRRELYERPAGEGNVYKVNELNAH